MLKFLSGLWARRTTVLGYAMIVIGSVAASDGLFSAYFLKWVALINGILVASLGHYNQRMASRNVAPGA